MEKTLMRTTILAYGTLVYVFFLGTFLYMFGFVENLVVPKSIDSGAASAWPVAVVVNAAILGLFAVQHAVMARPRFKRWWTRYVPAPAERSTFVLFTCLILTLLVWQWRPITAVVWSFENPVLHALLTTLSLAGWALVLYSSFLIDHFDLFGMRQVWLYFRGRAYTDHPFVEKSAYRFVRHPLMLGFLVAFWSTPHMTAGHLLFAVLTTGYILVGTWMEERDLARKLGEAYLAYRKRTPSLIPRPWRRRERSAAADPVLMRIPWPLRKRTSPRTANSPTCGRAETGAGPATEPVT